MKTIKLLLILLVFNANSIIAQDFEVDVQTIKSLSKTGLDFTNNKTNFIYIKAKSNELEKLMSYVNLEILKSFEEKFIDDELPEGGYNFKYIEQNTNSIWACKTEGEFKNPKGLLYNYVFKSACKNFNELEIPGGDMFIPGGDMFIPGGDTFIPGGDTFSKESGSYYFLKISFKGEQEIKPAILSLKIK